MWAAVWSYAQARLLITSQAVVYQFNAYNNRSLLSWFMPAGNNTYKAVQQASGAIAMGPIMQVGLACLHVCLHACMSGAAATSLCEEGVSC